MVLLGDEAQVEASFGSFGDSANLDARLAHGLRRTYHKPENCSGPTRSKLLADKGHVESRSVRLEMVLVLVQVRCTVCAKHTIASDIV